MVLGHTDFDAKMCMLCPIKRTKIVLGNSYPAQYILFTLVWVFIVCDDYHRLHWTTINECLNQGSPDE